MEELHIGLHQNKEKKMTEIDSYKLSDSTIGQIVKLLQIGILTGTDISDQMRTMRVVTNSEDQSVDPCPEYTKLFEENLERMKSLGDEQ